MKKALINIDYTNDFVALDGALSCGEPGIALEDYIVNLTDEFHQNGDYVAIVVDCHKASDKYHPETELFPAHCLKGTPGRDLYGKLEDLYQSIKDQENVEYFDKTRYSAFCGTNLDLKLRERNIKEIHLVGVCTDICILHTAVDAYNLGYEIVVHEKGVASFNQTGHQWALDHFKSSLAASVI